MKRKRIRPISDKKRKELLLQEFIPNSTLKRQSAKKKKQLLVENELKRKLYIKQEKVYTLVSVSNLCYN